MPAVDLGIDVGSVSTNIVLIDKKNKVVDKVYLRTNGQPIQALQKGLIDIYKRNREVEIRSVGTTGSARRLAGVIAGADAVKNEITAHAVAALQEVPDAQTVIEIGGQDSKIIILRNGKVADFAMNTVCAAGTGSFLDQQAGRLNLPIQEFGALALKAANPVRIAGRCSVFAESDMIHKQQMGHNLGDIVAGLCEALVRNYLSNVGKGKEILAPVVFQGGVAANKGMGEAFSKALQQEIIVPEYYDVMGAIGAALLAREAVMNKKGQSNFRGFGSCSLEFRVNSLECQGCANHCEVVELKTGSGTLARWGDRCGKWSEMTVDQPLEKEQRDRQTG